MDISILYTYYLRSSRVVIDSRLVQPGDLFFAFSGSTFNAAEKAIQAIEAGAVAVVVEDSKFAQDSESIFYFPSTLDALQRLAIYHRQQLTIPIIGITGSNGKTTTKELMATALSVKYNVQYTRGNLNNHIGCPLTLLSIRSEHQVAVVEMGANHPKEINELCQITQPDFGYVTNFGMAHLEGFGGVEGVIKAKSELYEYLASEGKTAIVNLNDPIQIERSSIVENRLEFGSEYTLIVKEGFVGLETEKVKILTHLTGEYNFSNLSAAVSIARHLGVDMNKMKKNLEAYLPTNMRSQVTEKEGRKMILDTYNANPSSMNEALKNLSNYQGKKIVILGDMKELGKYSEEEHYKILQQTKEMDLYKIITVGSEFGKLRNTEDMHFTSVENLCEYLKKYSLDYEIVLLKGSRGIRLEKAIDLL